MNKLITLITPLIFIAACQTIDYTGNENAPEFRIPVGSTLALNQAIEIPADRSTIWIFRGKVVTYNDVDIYYPHCQFRMKKISKQARRVRPDTFTITGINDWEDYHAQAQLRFADASRVIAGGRFSGSVAVGSGSGQDGGPSIVKYATIISLHSATQPEVKDMICSHWGDMGGVEAVTINETRKALGGIFSLKLKST